jgi:hypothetical protein
MRVLLDECAPRQRRAELRGHDVKTVAEAGWAGVKNGELLRLSNFTGDDTLIVRPFTVADAAVEPDAAFFGVPA